MTNRATHAPADTVAALLVPLINLNPFDWLGDKAKEGLADGWTAVMISIWSAGLWLLEAVFKILDRFLTPDLTDPGLVGLYGITLWISLVVAAGHRLRPDRAGRHPPRRHQPGHPPRRPRPVRRRRHLLGRRVRALVLASAGLTTGLLHGVLDIDGFAGYPAGAGWPDKVGGTVAATVLGLSSLLLLIPAGFGYVLIMLVREAALLILTATAPIAAAGALGAGTRAWMWKSLRWFLAACLTAPLLALVLGLGVQITRAAFPDTPPAPQPAPTTAPTADPADARRARRLGRADRSRRTERLRRRGSRRRGQPGRDGGGRRAIMVVGCFCPMALFRLLAFVDPGTGSGASLRSTLARQRRRPRPAHPAARPRDQRSPAPRPRPPPTDAPPASRPPTPRPATGSSPPPPAPSRSPAGGVAGTMRLLGGVASHGRLGRRRRHRPGRHRLLRLLRRHRAPTRGRHPDGTAAAHGHAPAPTGADRADDPPPAPSAATAAWPTSAAARPPASPRTRGQPEPAPTGGSGGGRRSGRARRRRGVPGMSVYGASATRDRHGWFFGLTGPQLTLLLDRGGPGLAGHGRRPLARPPGPGPGLGRSSPLLISVPVRGWSAAQWIGVLARHAVGSARGWTTWRVGGHPRPRDAGRPGPGRPARASWPASGSTTDRRCPDGSSGPRSSRTSPPAPGRRPPASTTPASGWPTTTPGS